jgi:Zn-dependent protease
MSQATQLKNKKAKFGAFAVLLAFAVNFKTSMTLFLQGVGILKFGWILKSALTMVVSLAVYTMAFGWGFAFMFITLLFIHEMGHWIWIKANRLDADAPIFIPFVGAIIALKQLPAEEATTAWVAFAGPLVGSAGAVAVWFLGSFLNNGTLMSGGSFGFLLNLFQLVPAKPLDGGFVLGAVSKVFLIPGMIFLFILAVLTHSALLFIVCILSIGYFRRPDHIRTSIPPAPRKQTIGEYEQQLVSGVTSSNMPPLTEPTSVNVEDNAASSTGAHSVPAIVPVSTRQRWAIALAYFSLAGFLAYMQVNSFEVIQERFHTKNPFQFMYAPQSANGQ